MSDFENYLNNLKFNNQLKKLEKKIKNKPVVLYGAGIFLEYILKHYDLSNLNIIGIADRRFENEAEGEFLGYKMLKPSEVTSLSPDYVLVSAIKFVNIIEDLYDNLLKDTKIKVKPLVNLPFIKLVKEIWNS